MYDRQLETVLNLSIPPRNYDEMREFSVDRIEYTTAPGEYLPTLMVKRTYSRAGLTLAYHELYSIGPRGGIKRHYSSFY